MRLIDADALIDDLKHDVVVDQDSLDYEELTDLNRGNIQFDKDCKQNAIDLLQHAPTIEPQQRWIPCSERLPEEKDAGILKKLGTSKRSEYVLATVEVKGERMTVTACTYDGEWDWNMKYAFPDYKIVAWTPLPEPWRGDAE